LIYSNIKEWNWLGVSHVRERRSAFRICWGKPEGRGSLGRPRLRCEYNIKVDPQEVGWEGMRWIDLTRGRDRWWAVVSRKTFAFRNMRGIF
jgi:hypothetical protein